MGAGEAEPPSEGVGTEASGDRMTPEGSAGGRATATVAAAADLQEARAAAQEQVEVPWMPAGSQDFERFLAVVEDCIKKLPKKGPDIRHPAIKMLESARNFGLPPEDRGFELWYTVCGMQHAHCASCAWALQSLQSRSAGLFLHVAACHIQRVLREAASRLFAHRFRRRPCTALRM